MSRSYRKPYYGNSYGGSKKWAYACRKWKIEANRVIRRIFEIKNYCIYKKINDVWTFPMEHKHGYSDEPKLRRK